MIKLNTSKGAIYIELDNNNTPATAANFLDYVRRGFYDGTIFHRVIDGFMIQGGGMQPDMSQKATKDPVKNEAKNAAPNKRGSVAMARTSDPHSATAQFFINVADNHFLDFKSETQEGYGYCVFGHVTEGMDIVDQIKSVATGHHMGHSDVPSESIVILSATEVDSTES